MKHLFYQLTLLDSALQVLEFHLNSLFTSGKGGNREYWELFGHLYARNSWIFAYSLEPYYIEAKSINVHLSLALEDIYKEFLKFSKPSVVDYEKVEPASPEGDSPNPEGDLFIQEVIRLGKLVKLFRIQAHNIRVIRKELPLTRKKWNKISK